MLQRSSIAILAVHVAVFRYCTLSKFVDDFKISFRISVCHENVLTSPGRSGQILSMVSSLSLNVGDCRVMTFSIKLNTIYADYSLNGEKLEISGYIEKKYFNLLQSVSRQKKIQ